MSSHRYSPPPTECSQLSTTVSTLVASEVGVVDSVSQDGDFKKLGIAIKDLKFREQTSHLGCIFEYSEESKYDLCVTHIGREEERGTVFLGVVIYIEDAIRKLNSQMETIDIAVDSTLPRQHHGVLHLPHMISLPLQINGQLTATRERAFLEDLHTILEKLIQRRFKPILVDAYKLKDIKFSFNVRTPMPLQSNPGRYTKTSFNELMKIFIQEEVTITGHKNDAISVTGLVEHFRTVWERERAQSHGDTGNLWTEKGLPLLLKKAILSAGSARFGQGVVDVKLRKHGIANYHRMTELMAQQCFVGVTYIRQPQNEIRNLPVTYEVLLQEASEHFAALKYQRQNNLIRTKRKAVQENLSEYDKKRSKY